MKPIETYRSLPKPIETYRSLPKPIETYRSLPKSIKTYRIRIICASDPVRRWYRDVTVSNADELRGEIEKFCMELEKKYPCAVRCESVELIQEVKNDD